jgi:hypothetical protein
MSQKVAAQVEARGSMFVDAPVSGGVGGAEAGASPSATTPHKLLNCKRTALMHRLSIIVAQ